MFSEKEETDTSVNYSKRCCPYKYKWLIFMAIDDSFHKALSVQDIYEWVFSHFPYFQDATECWENTIRQNLTTNKCFQKIKREDQKHKKLWGIDPKLHATLLNELKNEPNIIYKSTKSKKLKSSSQVGKLDRTGKKLKRSSQDRKLDSKVKPCTSKKSPQMACPDAEVNAAAAALLTLKNSSFAITQNMSKDANSTHSNHGLHKKQLQSKPHKKGKIILEDHNYAKDQSSSDEDGQHSMDDSKKEVILHKRICKFPDITTHYIMRSPPRL